MLDVMRQNLKSLKIFLWLVIAAFIGTIFFVWGQGGSSQQGSAGGQNAVAWVNGEPISYSSFESSYRNIYGFYRQMYGDNLSEEVLKTLQLEQVALNQLTQNVLLAQKAKEYEIGVSDDELISEIQSMPSFQTNNQFDPNVYKNLLAQNRIVPEDFEAQIKSSLITKKLELLIKQTARVSDQEVREEYLLQNDKLAIEGVLVKAESYKERVTMSDEETQAYYDAHKQDFTTPPRVKIQYVHYDPQTLKDEVTPTEEEIKAYYDANLSEFDKGREVKARHILFRTAQDATEEQIAEVKTKAEAVLKQAKEGADFAELAKTHSEDPGSKENGGDLGFFNKGRMVPEFENAAFALTVGQVSDLVKTQFGFHIIKVDEIREETDPYNAAKAEITDRLKLSKARELAGERAQIAYDDILNTPNLQEVATKDKLEVRVSNLFGNGEPIDENTIAIPQVQEAAFTLSADQKFSEPIETALGYYLIEFLEAKEPYIPELADIKDKVTEALRQEKAKALAKADAEAIQTALASGTPLQDVTTTFKGEAFAPRPFGKSQSYISEARGKSEELAKLAFTLRDGEYSAPFELESDYCVFRVKERTAADMQAFEQEKAKLTEQLLKQKQDAQFREFIDELKQNANIKYKEGLFS